MVMITKDYITIPQCEYDFHGTQGSQNSRRLAITIYGYNIYQHVKTHQMQNPNLLTSFIPLFSLNVLGKSVLISIATISTAFDWR